MTNDIASFPHSQEAYNGEDYESIFGTNLLPRRIELEIIARLLLREYLMDKIRTEDENERLTTIDLLVRLDYKELKSHYDSITRVSTIQQMLKGLTMKHAQERLLKRNQMIMARLRNKIEHEYELKLRKEQLKLLRGRRIRGFLFQRSDDYDHYRNM